MYKMRVNIIWCDYISTDELKTVAVQSACRRDVTCGIYWAIDSKMTKDSCIATNSDRAKIIRIVYD